MWEKLLVSFLAQSVPNVNKVIARVLRISTLVTDRGNLPTAIFSLNQMKLVHADSFLLLHAVCL